MHIGIASPITISEFIDYLNPDSQLIAKNLTGLKGPSIDTLIRGLISKGHQMSVYTLTPEVNEILELEGSTIKIFVAPYRKRAWERAIDLLSFESRQIEKMISMDSDLPEIIHAQWTYEYAKGAARYRRKIPIVVTVHDWAPAIFRLHPNYYYLSRLILDAIVFSLKRLNFIANSLYIADKVKKRWKKSIPCIPNAISEIYLSKLSQNTRNDSYTILSVSNNADKGKNIETLLYAYKQFKQIVPDCSLNLVGIPFSLSNPIIQKWKSANLLQGVNLLGPLSHIDLITEYDKASVLVHPSLEESFGLVLIEAMARKLPVIGGENSGAVPYVLGNGIAGLLCDVSSVESLLAAIIRVFKDKKLRIKFITNGEKLVNTIYSSNAVVDQTIKTYETLILQYK